MWLSCPTQTLIQGQWWSIFFTHLTEKKQYPLLKLCSWLLAQHETISTTAEVKATQTFQCYNSCSQQKRKTTLNMKYLTWQRSVQHNKAAANIHTITNPMYPSHSDGLEASQICNTPWLSNFLTAMYFTTYQLLQVVEIDLMVSFMTELQGICTWTREFWIPR